MVKRLPAPVPLISAGLGLLLLGTLLPWVLGGRRAWSDEQARAYTQAAAEFHSAKLSTGHDHHAAAGAVTPEQVAAAEARFQAQHRQLVAAQHRGQTSGRICQVLGGLLALAGIVGYVRRGES